MDWQTIVVVVAAVVALMVWKSLGLVSVRTALEHLKKGAQVIDVRTPEEFRRDHLPGAVNVPLHELEERIGKVAPDKNQPLLLHCLSGGRSGIAARKLRQLGYQKVFNLGGYSRAAKVVRQQAGR
ncbi:rhodanese-like domain-containing protein [Fontisphaera persica]|uniref:rhodanese-like domain-containing protein n=1 Tax=Fontisphaera persica TaxID=2974023 RepID=UPI0024BFFAC6|nr:rhodanese-like domain-containing protein [Fontisphaera persica]WCJ60766.1 rhodanese-like domain-containing protein [Fontisphaera persica]